MRSAPRRLRACSAALCVGLMLAACSGDDADTTGPLSDYTVTATSTPTASETFTPQTSTTVTESPSTPTRAACPWNYPQELTLTPETAMEAVYADTLQACHDGSHWLLIQNAGDSEVVWRSDLPASTQSEPLTSSQQLFALAWAAKAEPGSAIPPGSSAIFDVSLASPRFSLDPPAQSAWLTARAVEPLVTAHDSQGSNTQYLAEFVTGGVQGKSIDRLGRTRPRLGAALTCVATGTDAAKEFSSQDEPASLQKAFTAIGLDKGLQGSVTDCATSLAALSDLDSQAKQAVDGVGSRALSVARAPANNRAWQMALQLAGRALTS